jgi:cobalt-zinc-cadmium efflux system membrane fusion protein
MATRPLTIVVVAALGIAVGALVPEAIRAVRGTASWLSLPGLALQAQEPDTAKKSTDKQGNRGHPHRPGERHDEGPEGVVKISPERISAAQIELAPTGEGVLARRLTVPGVITPDANRIARVAAKVVGTVAELNKQLGDAVAKDEVVALLDSREVAEAKSEYLAAQVNFDLQKTLFERSQPLFQSKFMPENQYLRTKTTFTEAQLRLELARHKLSALNVSEREIAQLSRQTTSLQRYDIRSPIEGRVVERLVNLGAPVGGEGQAKELYVVADLSSVWIELSVPIADLPAIEEGQPVAISASADGKPSEGKIVFISPMLNQETRSARVIAAVENKDLTWRPGSYVTAQVVVEQQPISLRVPRAALQTINGEQVVFVHTADGFEKREVVLGKGDDQAVEVVFGLDPGEVVAVSNSFVLKAELGKAEAEHHH